MTSADLRQLLATVLLTAFLLAGCRSEEVPEHGAVDAPAGAPEPSWAAPLDAAARDIDNAMPGDFGVYVRRLGEEAGTLDRGGDRRWYLSSTVKVPVAIAVLERVDAGELSLDQQLVLAETDFVDGAGDMLMQAPGTRFSIATLLEKSLRDSDSTATDMLIRLLGEDALNRRVAEWSGGGFDPITTILQVRYDAYGALHPGVADLPNTALLRLRQAEAGEPRLAALARELGVERAELDAENLEAVFDAYYASGRNAATFEAFATVLEKLVTGELLSAPSTALILDHMRAITTGGARIQAGLPPGADFAQKTGTQLGRACNVGVLDPQRGADGATLVLACAEDYGELGQAERAFQALGAALAEVGLAGAGD